MNTRIRAATLSPAIALALLWASNVSAADPTVPRRAPAETPPISQNTPGSPDRVVLLAIDDVSLPSKNVCLYLIDCPARWAGHAGGTVTLTFSTTEPLQAIVQHGIIGYRPYQDAGKEQGDKYPRPLVCPSNASSRWA